jgi:hypothetical protein
MLKPSAVDQVIIAAQKIYTAQAYDVMDRLIVAKDAVTGLLPLHVKTDGGKLVASDISEPGFETFTTRRMAASWFTPT